jgi:hypothetical protein
VACDSCPRMLAVMLAERLETQCGRRSQVVDSVFYPLQANILASHTQAPRRSKKLEHNISRVSYGLACDLVGWCMQLVRQFCFF